MHSACEADGRADDGAVEAARSVGFPPSPPQPRGAKGRRRAAGPERGSTWKACLLYTSDAADDM
eukprot:7430117-Alexandrium_andersonii.AAC.1